MAGNREASGFVNSSVRPVHTRRLRLPSKLNMVSIAIQMQMPIIGLKPFRVPTRTGKPGKLGRYFPLREKSGNFGHTGKVRKNHTKYWETQGI